MSLTSPHEPSRAFMSSQFSWADWLSRSCCHSSWKVWRTRCKTCLGSQVPSTSFLLLRFKPYFQTAQVRKVQQQSGMEDYGSDFVLKIHTMNIYLYIYLSVCLSIHPSIHPQHSIHPNPYRMFGYICSTCSCHWTICLWRWPQDTRQRRSCGVIKKASVVIFGGSALHTYHMLMAKKGVATWPTRLVITALKRSIFGVLTCKSM